MEDREKRASTCIKKFEDSEISKLREKMFEEIITATLVLFYF